MGADRGQDCRDRATTSCKHYRRINLEDFRVSCDLINRGGNGFLLICFCKEKFYSFVFFLFFFYADCKSANNHAERKFAGLKEKELFKR